jgi:acylglycerol lipase
MRHIEKTINAADGITLYEQTWLSDHDKKGLVCLVHGLGEHSGRYAHVGKMLADSGYVTTAFDLRGHGKSGGRRGHSPSFEAFLDDIAIIVDQNKTRFPGIPLFLFGHSLGSLLVLNFTVRRKPKLDGLIITGPALRNELETQQGKVALINILYRIFPTLTMATGLDVNQLSQDKGVVEAYIKDPLVHDRASLSMAKYSLQSIDWIFDHAAEIRDPILIMQGSMDKICFPSGTLDFVDKLPGDVTVKFWDGFYHEIHNEPGAEEVIQFMIGWLNNQIA